ncbi:putative integral membrane protein [Aspergillus floccosus]
MVQGRSEAIVVVTASVLALSTLTVTLRCYTRLYIMRAFGWDDTIMITAMVFNIVFCICTFMGATYGFGQKNVWFLERPNNLRIALLCWWLGQIFYIWTCVVAKISIVLTLLRITIVRTHAIILYIITTLNVIVGLLFFFFSIFQCKPIDFFWDRMTKRGTCLDPDLLLGIVYLYTVMAAVTDFTIGLLPIFMIWNLQMRRRTKFSLAVILGLGIVASSAVIIRIPFLQTFKDEDFLYATWQISIWSNVEANLGIAAGSMSTIRPLIRKIHNTSLITRIRHRTHAFQLFSLIGKSHRSGGEVYSPTFDNEYGSTTTVPANQAIEQQNSSA